MDERLVKEHQKVKQWALRNLPASLNQDEHLQVIVDLIAYTTAMSRQEDTELYDIINPLKANEKYLYDLAALFDIKLDKRVPLEYQRLYMSRFLENRRIRGTVQSLKNVAASFHQTYETYVDSILLNDIRVIEYGVNDQGFNLGDEPWLPGMMYVALHESSKITYEKIKEISPAGTKIILGYISEVHVPDYPGPWVYSQYENMLHLLLNADPDSDHTFIGRMRLKQVYDYRVNDDFVQYRKYNRVTGDYLNEIAKRVDAVAPLGLKVLSSRLFSELHHLGQYLDRRLNSLDTPNSGVYPEFLIDIPAGFESQTYLEIANAEDTTSAAEVTEATRSVESAASVNVARGIYDDHTRLGSLYGLTLKQLNERYMQVMPAAVITTIEPRVDLEFSLQYNDLISYSDMAQVDANTRISDNTRTAQYQQNVRGDAPNYTRSLERLSSLYNYKLEELTLMETMDTEISYEYR